MVVIERYIRDTERRPLAGIPVKAYQQRLPLDRTLTESTQPTENEGYFRIVPQRNISETASNVYIVIIDKSKSFVSVRDGHSRFKRKNSSVWHWRSQIISNLNNVIEVVVKQNCIRVPTECDSVAIGSGFGGTVVSLAIAKMYKDKNESNRVCIILERGQWWISHVIPDSNPLREFLVENDMPFSTWRMFDCSHEHFFVFA